MVEEDEGEEDGEENEPKLETEEEEGEEDDDDRDDGVEKRGVDDFSSTWPGDDVGVRSAGTGSGARGDCRCGVGLRGG